MGSGTITGAGGVTDSLYREFDQLTEADIKTHIEQSTWSPKKCQRARLYLNEKEYKRALTAQAEQVAIARSTKNAAWAAIVISFVALIISAASFIKTFHMRGPWQP